MKLSIKEEKRKIDVKLIFQLLKVLRNRPLRHPAFSSEDSE